MRFTEGEEVLAKHPSTNDYHRGRIVSTKGDRYKVKFHGGVEYSIYENDIKTSRVSRSATRKSSRLAKKSPQRQSPSRRSSRRSPAKSPGRSHSSSIKKAQIQVTKLPKISLSRIEISSDKASTEGTMSQSTSTGTESPVDNMSLQLRLRDFSSLSRRSTRSTSTTLKTESEHKTIMFTRSVDRAASLPVNRSPIRDFLTDERAKEREYSLQREQSLSKGSDYRKDMQPDSTVTEKRKKEISLVSEPQEWGGWFGTSILLFAFPLCIILPQLACTKNRCKSFPFDVPMNVKYYVDLKALLAYAGFLLFLTFVSFIPVGKQVNGQQSKLGILQYRMNGLLAAILSVIILYVCSYKNLGVNEFILDNCLRLSISGWLLGTILALTLYAKASRAPLANLNIYASTDSVIYNFWQGKEINPRVGRLDFKILLYRASLIGSLIINLAVAMKAVEETENLSFNDLNVAVLLGTLLQTFYVIDALIFESTVVTSFEVMYEGTGYMLCVGHLLYPFLPTLTTRFMLYEKKRFDYLFVLSILAFLLGYFLYRVSNLQKDEFRKNPLSPRLARFETIPTSRGKKLLVSGLWGKVRHPNYLGDILMQWAIVCTSLANDILPYYPAICCTIALLYRAKRDNARCKTRYDLAWEQYCSRVKYMMLNRIF